MRLIMRASLAVTVLGVASIALAACSTSDVMRPTIDIQETAAVTVPPSIAPALAAPPSNMDVYDPDAAPSVDGELEVDPPMSTPGDASDYEIPDAAQSDDQPAYEKPPPEIAPAPAEPKRRFGFFGYPPAPRLNAQMPSGEVECRRQLKRMGATFRDKPRIQEGSCGIAYPVELTALSGGVQMKPAATLTCKMALTVATWTKKELVPAARLRYFSGIKTIHQGSSYSCRRIAGSRTLSEHGKGNALDIMKVELNSGKDIGIRKKGLFAFRERGLLNNVRGDACKYFSTVLGPGYNYDHRNHFHFDIANRRNGRVSCH